MNHRKPFVITLFVSLALGCKEDGIDDLIDDVLAQWSDQAVIVCDCWESLDRGDGSAYESREACEQSFRKVLPAQRRCIEEAFNRDEAASKTYLTCHLPIEGEFTDCLDANLSCTDITGVQACGEDYALGIEQCEELPATVERGLEECDLE